MTVESVDNLTVCEDITEPQETERMLREKEKLFREFVESSLTAIAMVEDDRVIYYNSEAESLLGPFQESYRLSRFSNVLPDDLEKAKDFYNEIISQEDTHREVTLRVLPLGKEDSPQDIRTLFCRATKIQYQGSEAILMNMMDITRTIELEHQVMINDRMTSLGRIAAGVIHELRNSLSGINLYLSALRNQMHDSLRNQGVEGINILENILEKLQSASNSIESMTSRVMDFARPGISKMILTDLNQTIEEACGLCLATVRKEEIQLEKCLHESTLRCYTDPRLIQQVILNLITNASQAMEHSGMKGRIELRSWKEENWACFSVADSGPGIPPALRTKIFDPFFTTKEKRIGIGLSVCQKIIEDHGGSLTATASSLGGAEFMTKIPIEKRGQGR